MPTESSLTLIMPAYNEGKALIQYLPSVIEFCKKKNYTIIIVNDGSTDSTQEFLLTYSNLSYVKIINNKVNAGYGASIKKAIRIASTKYIVTLDADGQHSLDDLENLYQKACSLDADMVVGERKNSLSRYRSIGKFIIRKVANFLMPLPIRDINSGLKLYDTQLAKKYINICPDTMAYSDIILLSFLHNKHLVIGVPIVINERTNGQSTVNTMSAVNTLMEILNIIIMFNPMRIFLSLSFFCIILSIVWGIPILLDNRGLSVGALLGLMTGILILFFGLLAEQISALRKSILDFYSSKDL